MGYKTTSAERTQATSAISSAIAAFNNPDGSGFALTSTALTEGVGLKQYTIIPGTNPVNSETSIGGAVITAVAITDSNYAVLDDTALATTGGYIKLTGTGFKTGCIVYVGGVAATTTTFVSSTEVRAAIGSNSSNTFTVALANPDGSAGFYMAGIAVSGVPAWSTNATLTAAYEQAAYSQTLTANSNSSIAYSLKSGSTLPAGVSLNSSTGVLSGTTPADTGTTTYTFTIIATDAENQDTERLFSLTINTDTVTWSSPAAGTSYTITPTVTVSNISLSASALSGRAVTYSANTLPTGLTLSSGVIFGTISGSSHPASTLLTATNSYRPATRVINWNLVLSDLYFKYNTVLLNGESLAGTGNTWIKDSSTNNFAITTAGDARSNNFSPYNTTWSVNFGAYTSGIGLFCNPGASVAFGSGDFTVECWAYMDAVPSGQGENSYILDTRAGGGSWAFSWNWTGSSTPTTLFWTRANDTYFNATSTMSYNSWNHVAYVRSSGVGTIYLNGVSVGTAADTSTYGNITKLNIGLRYQENVGMPGYLSNFRIVNGTAVYTSNFTPPTSPLTAISGTAVLTCQSNRFVDNSTNNFAISISGSRPKVVGFSPFTETDTLTGSGYFDGTGDNLTAPQGSAFQFPGDFTIECWVYANNSVGGASYDGVFDTRSGNVGSSNSAGINFKPDGYLNLYVGGNNVASSVLLGARQWVHVALVRSGSAVTMYQNGVSVATTTTSANLSDGYFTAGGFVSSGYWNGYISNIRVVKGTALYTTAFTPPTAPLTAIANTSLLTLQSRQSANNNSFLDDSNNKSLITRNGNATQGTFTPFSQTGWSTYFQRSNTDYLGLPNASCATGSNDFSIEAFVFLIDRSSNYAMFGGNTDRTTAGGSSITLTITSGNGYLEFTGWFGGSPVNMYSPTLPLHTWTHLVVCRTGGTLAMFVDGTRVTTTSCSGSINAGSSSNNPSIGSNGTGSADNFTGYISNFRMIIGSGVYSASSTSFTVPTTPLTAVANTRVLACQDNRYIDRSTNTYTITPSGSPSVQAFSPFAPTAAYSTSLIGGSMYNSATPDGLSFTTSSTQFGISGDFTIEQWVYPTVSTSSYNILWSLGDSSGSDNPSVSLHYNSSFNLFWLNNGGGGNGFDSGAGINIVPFQWNHIAISRSGANIRCWTNGTLRISNWTASGIDANKRYLYVTTNRVNSDTSAGYTSGFRFVNGSAVYSGAANFSPPLLPPTNITNTVALVNSTNAGIYDATAKNVVQTVGTAKLSSVQSKYGGTSMKFDGSSSSWLLIPFSQHLNLSTGSPNWTIECWVYVNSFGNNPFIFNKGGVAATYYTNYGFAVNSSGLAYMHLGNNGGETSYNFGTISTGTWYHLAGTRSGSTIRTFLDGTLVTNTSIGAAMTDNGEALYVGCLKNLTTNVLDGYVDDLRIAKGIARYTTSFTPPTAALLL